MVFLSLCGQGLASFLYASVGGQAFTYSHVSLIHCQVCFFFISILSAQLRRKGLQVMASTPLQAALKREEIGSILHVCEGLAVITCKPYLEV